MEALVYGRTANPQPVADAAEQLTGVRAARFLVGGPYDVLAAVEAVDTAGIAAVVQTLRTAGFGDTSVLPVLDPSLYGIGPANERMAPWHVVDKAVNLFCALRVNPSAAAAVYLALSANTTSISGLAFVLGEADIAVKISVGTEAEVQPALLAVALVAGVREMTSSYALAP